MQVDIWSDVVCPWCAVGKAHLDAALAEFEHSDEVQGCSFFRNRSSGPVSRRPMLRITFAVAADDAGGVGPGSTYWYVSIHDPPKSELAGAGSRTLRLAPDLSSRETFALVRNGDRLADLSSA